MTSTVQPKLTYRACTLGPVAFTSTADVFLGIIGSATKRVTVQRIVLSCPTLTAATLLDLLVQKCSVAPTGGTLSNGVPATAVALTSVAVAGGTAATAVVSAYAVGATIGTLIGTLASRRVMGLTATPLATDGDRSNVVIDFRSVGENSAPALDGVAQALIVKFHTAPGSTTSMTAEVEYTEEG